MSLKEKRTIRGLTQEDLAREMNVSQASVAMWETGKAKPTADNLIKLAEVLECSVDDLLRKES